MVYKGESYILVFHFLCFLYYIVHSNETWGTPNYEILDRNTFLVKSFMCSHIIQYEASAFATFLVYQILRNKLDLLYHIR